MAVVSDAELAELNQAHALLKSLYADAKVGTQFKKLVKEKYPNASIPDLEVMSQVETHNSALSKKIDDFLSAQAKKEEDSQVGVFSDRVARVAKERGFTKEGTEQLLTLMKERGIHDPEDAAIIFETTRPKDITPKSYSSRMNFVSSNGDDDADFKKLMSDPEQYMVDGMMAAIDADNQH